MSNFKYDINSKEWQDTKNEYSELINRIQRHFVDKNENFDKVEKEFDYRPCQIKNLNLEEKSTEIPAITIKFLKNSVKIPAKYLLEYSEKHKFPGHKDIK